MNSNQQHHREVARLFGRECSICRRVDREIEAHLGIERNLDTILLRITEGCNNGLALLRESKSRFHVHAVIDVRTEDGWAFYRAALRKIDLLADFILNERLHDVIGNAELLLKPGHLGAMLFYRVQ